MTKYLVLPMLARVGSTAVLSLSLATAAFAQDAPYSEDMRQHDRAERAEYLQEMEHSDPLFYVPLVNDASFPATNNTLAN